MSSPPVSPQFRRTSRSITQANVGDSGEEIAEETSPSNTTQHAADTPSSSMNERKWKCSNPFCDTVQTYKDRQGVGRKVTSNFFGRNKRETKLIHPEVWHWSCRMHYQRSSYLGQKPGMTEDEVAKEVCEYYLDYMRVQVVRISLWRPEATFKVQLEKAAKNRLNRYHEALRRNGGDEDAAREHVKPIPKKSKGKGKLIPLTLSESVGMEHAEYIDTYFSGDFKDYGDVHTIIDWIQNEVDEGEMLAMPPIEFLISEEKPGETVIDPSTNFERWVVYKESKKDGKLPAAAKVASNLKAAKAGAFDPQAAESDGEADDEPEHEPDGEPEFNPRSPTLQKAARSLLAVGKAESSSSSSKASKYGPVNPSSWLYRAAPPDYQVRPRILRPYPIKVRSPSEKGAGDPKHLPLYAPPILAPSRGNTVYAGSKRRASDTSSSSSSSSDGEKEDEEDEEEADAPPTKKRR